MTMTLLREEPKPPKPRQGPRLPGEDGKGGGDFPRECQGSTSKTACALLASTSHKRVAW